MDAKNLGNPLEIETTELYVLAVSELHLWVPSFGYTLEGSFLALTPSGRIGTATHWGPFRRR